MSEIQPPVTVLDHAGTLEDPIEVDAIFRDENDKIYKLGGGSGGGDNVVIAPATDQTLGIVKLTDDPNLEASAAKDFTAITPNGVRALKTEIDGKIEQVEQAVQDVQDAIENGEIGGGGDSSNSYVVRPQITAPASNATSVSVAVTIVGTAYRCVFDDEARKHREFQIATDSDFGNIVAQTNLNADSWSVAPALSGNTAYYVRVRDVSASGLTSPWSSSVKFTTGNEVQIVAPTLTLHGYNDSASDILSGFSVTATAFAVDNSAQDTHVSTTWYIDQVSVTRSAGHVWESLNDVTNKTSITVPDGTLQKSTQYRLSCIYHGNTYGDSAAAVVEFTTSDDFGSVVMPTLTVEGAPDNIFSNPTLTAGAFSNTRPLKYPSEQHDLTDWKIVPAAGGASVWESLNDSADLTSKKPPENTLQVSTAYKACVRYHGKTLGWSEWREVEFTTKAVFASIDTPTLTVTGTPNDVLETPTLTLSQFQGTNETFKSTNWRAVRTSDSAEVWSATTETTSVTIPSGKLAVSTQYRFMAQYVGQKGVTSGWATTLGTTADSFVIADDIGTPDSPAFGTGVAPTEVYESVGAKPLPGTNDPTSFQYGLYELTATSDANESGSVNEYQHYHAYVKYIPKFYYTFLSANDTTLLTDEELKPLEQYTGLTVAQMKEAQNRAGTSAIALASANIFKNEADANEHGFILHRGFIDGGVEQDGFFISNTLASYFYSNDTVGNNETQYYIGMPSYKFEPTYKYNIHRKGLVRLDGATPAKKFGLPNTLACAVELSKKFAGFNCMAPWQWAAICTLAFVSGLYCKDATECAWYAKGFNAAPMGINQTSRDERDATVKGVSMDGTSGTCWVDGEDAYKKTTHNGRINGITNCNGWLWQVVVGANSMFNISPITAVHADLEAEIPSGLQSTSYASSGNWSDGNQPLFRDAHSPKRDFFMIGPQNSKSSAAKPGFGGDQWYPYSGNYVPLVGGGWSGGASAGLFYRYYGGRVSGWAYSYYYCGFRLAGYPKKKA